MMRSVIRSSARPFVVLALILGVAGVWPSAASAASATHTVILGNASFSPKGITIHRGDTIKWKNPSTAALAHDVTSDLAGYFKSPGGESGLTAGKSYSKTFKQAGTFRYLCRLHWGMTGTIRVPIKVSRSGGTFTITLASATSSSAWKNRLQVQKPGSTTWTTITTTTSRTVTWSSSKHGTFRFRSAVRRTSTGDLSGWSPVVSKTR